MESKHEPTRANTPHSHVPYGEAGSGHYSNQALDTVKCIDEITPAVLESLASIPVNRGSVFSIADYGCADGGISMPLIYKCVEELRRLYGEGLQICVNYDDQPVNDFKSLFCFLHGLLPGPHHSSYLTEFRNVYTSACGTSFYNQCFPSGSVHVGISTIAVHWLSRKPCSLTDAVYHLLAKNQDEREMFRQQAESDWETFLCMRANELSPGGRLTVALLAVQDEEHLTGYKKNLTVQQAKVMHKVLVNMAKDGIISNEEVHKTTFSSYHRSREDVMKPFESKESPIKKAGLFVVSMEIKGVHIPYWTKNGDAGAAAKRLTNETRSWTNYTFLSGLSDARSPEEKLRIVDEFYSRLEVEFVLLVSEENELEMITAFVVIEKAIK